MTDTQQFEVLLAKANAAGQAALDAAAPTPMTVYETVGLSDTPKPGGRIYNVPEGPCGFAWVRLRPATSPLARYIRKTRFDLEPGFGTSDRAQMEADGGSWGKSYYGGYELFVWGGGQSYERKIAYARAYAEVLREAGYDAYAGGRLD